MSVMDIGDTHGSYSQPKSNSDKDIYIYDKVNGTFNPTKEIKWDQDSDVLYYKNILKDGVVVIKSDKVSTSYAISNV